MSNLVKLLEEQKPRTANANLKGKDLTPIGADGGNGVAEASPSLNLSKDEVRLFRGRRGVLGGGHPSGVTGYTDVAKYTDVTTRS